MHVRWFRLLLRLFPAEFRGDFGDEMQADLRDQHDEARQGGRLAEARMWGRTLPNLFTAALRQHLDVLWRDAGYAVRVMARAPGSALAAIVMIALGTGANAAMFSVIDAILLRSPFPDSSRLALVSVHGVDGRTTAALSIAHFRALGGAAPVLESVGAIGSGRGPIVTGLGNPHRVSVECITAGMFRTLATSPILGRTFTADEDRPGGPGAIVLGELWWRRELGGDPDAIGRTLTLNGRLVSIVGIMPRSFAGPYSRNNTDAWLPLGPSLEGRPVPGCAAATGVNVVARLGPGATLNDAAVAATDRAGIAHIEDANHRTGGRLSLTALDYQVLSELRAPLLALLGAVALVLMIACANVANLQLARVHGQRAELSVRLALGATRGRIVRQVLVENLTTFIAGGAAGVAVGSWTLGTIVSLLPAYVPHVKDIVLNGRVLAGTLAVTLAAACVSGIVPALYGSHPALISQLRVARGSTHGRDWTRRALVVSQVALSLVLLVGAALMIRTFATLRPVSPGFAADDKVTAFVRLQGSAVPPRVFFDALRDRLRVLPGVLSVSGSTYEPMSGMVSARRVSAGGAPVTAFSGVVTANYFDDMAIPIVEGRGFTAADVAGAPLGATLDMVPLEAGASDPRERVQIVGVTRDTRCNGGDLTPCAEVYVPFAQAPEPGMTMFVRAVNPRDPRLADGIRAAAAAIDPAQVVDRLEPLQDMLDTRVATSRFGAWLLGTFAAIAVALAAIGIAASTAWWVGQRTREIGLRTALGAQAGTVTWMFLRQGLLLAGCGVLIGIGAAMASTRLLQSWLYGVTPLDPGTFFAAAGTLFVIALIAAYLPARRAARVDPLVALRAE